MRHGGRIGQEAGENPAPGALPSRVLPREAVHDEQVVRGHVELEPLDELHVIAQEAHLGGGQSDLPLLLLDERQIGVQFPPPQDGLVRVLIGSPGAQVVLEVLEVRFQEFVDQRAVPQCRAEERPRTTGWRLPGTLPL